MRFEVEKIQGSRNHTFQKGVIFIVSVGHKAQVPKGFILNVEIDTSPTQQIQRRVWFIKGPRLEQRAQVLGEVEARGLLEFFGQKGAE